VRTMHRSAWLTLDSAHTYPEARRLEAKSSADLARWVAADSGSPGWRHPSAARPVPC
jgi:hypothetical protein